MKYIEMTTDDLFAEHGRLLEKYRKMKDTNFSMPPLECLVSGVLWYDWRMRALHRKMKKIIKILEGRRAEEKSKCCGRCDGFNDICPGDTSGRWDG